MTKIQDAFYIDGKPYLELSEANQSIIDKASEKLKPEEILILGFESAILNIITTDPNYSLLIQSEFPEDLTGKMVFAYTSSRI